MFLLSEDLESMEVIIVIDIGTSSIKTAAIGLKGGIDKIFSNILFNSSTRIQLLRTGPPRLGG